MMSGDYELGAERQLTAWQRAGLTASAAALVLAGASCGSDGGGSEEAQFGGQPDGQAGEIIDNGADAAEDAVEESPEDNTTVQDIDLSVVSPEYDPQNFNHNLLNMPESLFDSGNVVDIGLEGGDQVYPNGTTLKLGDSGWTLHIGKAVVANEAVEAMRPGTHEGDYILLQVAVTGEEGKTVQTDGLEGIMTGILTGVQISLVDSSGNSAGRDIISGSYPGSERIPQPVYREAYTPDVTLILPRQGEAVTGYVGFEALPGALRGGDLEWVIKDAYDPDEGTLNAPEKHAFGNIFVEADISGSADRNL